MVQLKIRTEYSFGQTFAPVDRIIDRGKELGCSAMGIVDNSTWGHVKWYNSCVKAGIQPLLGVENYVSVGETLLYMWFLARNKAGLTELYRAISKGHAQALSTRSGKVPLLYEYDVIGMSDNILKFAGDVTNGEFLKQIGAYMDIDPSSQILNMRKRQVAKQFDLPIVGVSDNAYVREDDVETFELTAKASVKATPQHILSELEGQRTRC